MYSHAMQRKKVIIVIGIILFIFACCAVFFLTRPRVVFLHGTTLPESYEISLPSNFFEYILVDNPENADLVIASPVAQPPAVPYYLFGREKEEGENPIAVLNIDESAMWEAAPAGKKAVVYERSSSAADEIADNLIEHDDTIERITYSGRVSGANVDSVRKRIEECGAEYVLLLTPSSSLPLLRGQREWKAVLDERDAAALETTPVEYAVAVDWDRTISALLSGEAELSYCLITL